MYAIHNFPSLETGKFAVRAGSIMAAEDNFEITINGVGHHAAMPHLGKDTIVIGAEIVTAMQTLVSRSLDPIDNAVVSFTEFVSNGTVNVVPGQVVLKGDTRSLTIGGAGTYRSDHGTHRSPASVPPMARATNSATDVISSPR